MLRKGFLILSLAVALPLAGGAAGQSVLQRTPNLSGGWEAAPGTLYFNFLHRFIASDGPVRKVSNVPTFLLGAGLPGGILVAANYSTNSDLVAAYPNEWEFFGRYVPLSEFRGGPVDLAIQAGYNNAAESFDAELNAARQLGRLRLIGAARWLSNGYHTDSSRMALGGGALLQVNRWLAVGGDVVQLLDRDSTEESAWSGALQLAIPYTPHSLSLQVTNTTTSTVQGSSRGSSTRRYGFEFTIPVNLGRYFGKRPEAAPAPVVPSEPAPTPVLVPVARDTAAQPVRDTVRPPVRDTVRAVTPVDTTRRDTTRAAPARTPPAAARPPQTQTAQAAAPRPVSARMRQLNFEPRRLQITAGTVVVWRNDDQVVHTVKAADGSWESPTINPGGSYRRTFSRPGRYEISCGPHPFMKQTIEVK